jgi:hypothetical protein
MAAGIEIYNYVTNQKGSPALYSDVFANRPAAGFIGRLFISTDTLEIYRDNGTTWALISGGGGGVNIYNSDGTLTAARTMTMANHSLTFEGGANDARLIMSANNNVPRIFSFRTANVARWDFRVTDNETGSNAGGNWYLRAHNDAGVFTFAPISVERKTGEKSFYAEESLTNGSDVLTGTYSIAGGTYAAGLTMIGGNPHGAEHNNFTLANAGNLTFANSIYLGAQSNVLRLQANNAGTITMQAASPGIRTAAVSLNQIQYNTSTGVALVYSHASVMQALGIYRLVAAGSLTITNGYGLIINDLNEYGYASTGGGALSITNRWGIYQDSTTDVNYLGGTTLVGTTTNAGYKFDINGTLRAVNTVTFGSLSGTGTRMVVADASGVLSTQAIPGGGGISGSGTTNFVAKFTGASSIGNSLIFDNGTNVGIGNSSPSQKLEVSGSVRADAYVANSAAPVFNATLNTADAQRVLMYMSGTNGVVQVTRAGGTQPNLTFATESGEYMRLTAAGNFLVGLTTDSGQRLQVSGEIRLTGNLLMSPSTALRNTASQFIDFGTGGSGELYFRSGAAFDNVFTIISNNYLFAASSFGGSATRTLVVASGTAPTTSPADAAQLYVNDITAGNAAFHTRTENGAVIKLYQETTGVAAATFSANTGTAVNDASTFDGYTLKQVVKALRNLGILA